ncbi:hypothetical protein ACFFLZ_22945 [Photobacterium aphoticum]|uniref:Uncharacterized protein n=1 Tax=Photobacterium aphoticum TaxID=754436 RepID=A0A090RI67_9GAMM|nr:hypothetical protein [Photobacterium aphoticum]KLV02824.1 hypothetical protein ABT58_01855 [Photobacterium aphoticum]PSU58154.1 hypothetical protein C9I90_07680 [Photobacterium aphoticum]GAL07227.1 hypothetical protein JCM19237_4643 [Photobacterium aphoticum]GHA36351.1 hypothetical protein GCM10007086_06960 [Photobacterium aphoticum]
MSFSEHLDNFIKQREQQGQAPGQSYKRKHVIQDPTNQSLAREALAKAQEEASLQATVETKLPHYRINGRCVTDNEAHALHQLETASAPANPERIAYIEQLRKSLKLKKRS